MPGDTGGSSGRPVGNMATTILLNNKSIRTYCGNFPRIILCFVIYNNISVSANVVIDIGVLIVHLVTLEVVGRWVMLHVRLTATEKQLALTNPRSATRLVERACTHASRVKSWFYYLLSVSRTRPSCSGFTQSSPVYLVRCFSVAGFRPIKYACHISVDKCKLPCT